MSGRHCMCVPGIVACTHCYHSSQQVKFKIVTCNAKTKLRKRTMARTSDAGDLEPAAMCCANLPPLVSNFTLLQGCGKVYHGCQVGPEAEAVVLVPFAERMMFPWKMLKKIRVFCGSSSGKKGVFTNAALNLGCYFEF